MSEIALENSYALIIGVANYHVIRKLPYTADATEMASALKDPEVCGYTRVSSLEEAAATRESILAKLDQLARIPPGSTVLIYFSGHGGRIDSGEHRGDYLLPFETVYPKDEDLARTAISSELFTQKLNAIALRADRLTVILDCCHAGGIGQTRDLMTTAVVPGLSDDYIASLASGKGRVILAATRAEDPAYVLNGAKHGLFTQYLLEGLRGGAPGDRGVIRVVDLFSFVVAALRKLRPSQQPVLKAEIQENYPIALHLGGKLGSGETVQGGLGVLLRLAREPAIQAALQGIKGQLKSASERIRDVKMLKELHDKLHDIQVNLFTRIRDEREHLPGDRNSVRNIPRHANEVTREARAMSAIATPKYPQAQPWLDDLTRAAAKVIRGVTAGPLDELDEGICDMDYVLSVRPSQLNTDLRENVRAMNLGELFRSLIGLQDRMVELKVSPDDVRNFAAGGRDLGRLNRELNDLMNQHNSWQDIDNRMRQVEVSLTTGDRMLTFSWKSLSEQLRAQLDAVDPMYVEDLKGSLDDLTAKVSGGTREEKEDAFFSLRSVTQRWFYALDQTLLDRCGELIPIEAALNAILPVVMESNP